MSNTERSTGMLVIRTSRRMAGPFVDVALAVPAVLEQPELTREPLRPQPRLGLGQRVDQHALLRLLIEQQLTRTAALGGARLDQAVARGVRQKLVVDRPAVLQEQLLVKLLAIIPLTARRRIPLLAKFRIR